MRKFNLDIDEFTDPCTCHAWVATAVIGSAVIGAGASIYSSNQAAQAQENATNTAAGTQMAMYNTTRSDLLPYNTAGQGALKTLQDNNYYTAPITMDQATLEKTPGYQFNLTQGLKAVQNSAAARGLGNSGAALKGAASFATGLADNTYQNQFNNANTNQTNAYNRLQTIVSGGQNAAAATSNAGVSAANGASNAIIGGGNAAAAGYNAVGGAVTNAANNIGGYYAYKGLYGGGSGTASTSSTSPVGP